MLGVDMKAALVEVLNSSCSSVELYVTDLSHQQKRQCCTTQGSHQEKCVMRISGTIP